MERSTKTFRILVGAVTLIIVSVIGLLTFASATRSTEWPFGDDSRDAFNVVPDGDFVVTVGTAAWTPGSSVLANVGAAFKADPFFTRGMTEVAISPIWSAEQILETGLRLDWWSASVDMTLSLVPWGLMSAGGWLEIHPPEWMILDHPVVTLDTHLGWGPQWIPDGEWGHALAGRLDVQAAWALPTFWEHPLDLIAESSLSGAWAFPSGDLAPKWQIALDIRSRLPILGDSTAALRAGVTAGVSVFPVFGFGFDMQMEFRAGAFTAYGMVGASGTGVRVEAGADLSFGLSLSGDSSMDAASE